jgi:dTDP-4-amino-4,6-dideoxygalactose transaminase
MKYPRVNLYLNFKQLLRSIFKNYEDSKILIEQEFKKKVKKKYVHFTGMCRTSFLLVLEYLIERYPNKKEIIICAYNLKELVDIARLKNFKIILIDIDKENGMISKDEILKNISKNTSALLYTHMFNDYSNLIEIVKVCKANGILVIEDLAIYYGNVSKNRYAGSLGDVSILSFGIMKNISAFFGGALLTNNEDISQYANNRINCFHKFPAGIYFNKFFLFIILKFFLSRIIYNLFFFYIIRLGIIKNIFFINSKIYPALKFEKKKTIPKFYYSKISTFSIKIISTILKDRLFNQSTKIRKINNKYFFDKLKNSKHVKIIPIRDFDFQNFFDFPIIVKNKKTLAIYLLKKGLETRVHFYENCEDLINNEKKNINADYFENHLICLPSHSSIKKNLIDKYCIEIENFYAK